jgi:8-oxo-dGTP diphosphatase
MPYSPILATLGYVVSPDGRRVLLIHRNVKPGDHHFGKFNGLGGKMEPGENVVQCMKREIREEAGIECDSLILRGTVSWPGFGKHGEDWFGFIFRIDAFSGTPFQANDEGTLVWVDIDRMDELNLWEGDRRFLPLVFDRDSPQFHGVIPYQDGRPLRWDVCLI